MGTDTTPNHGIGGKLGRVAGRSDTGKAIVHTIDPEFILGIARISEFGARKYHMRNFLMAPGMPWSQVYGSLMRHLMLWWGGEELDLGPNGEYGPTDDEETNMKWSGMPHLWHVAWNVMVLCTYQRPVYSPGDDRPGSLEYVGGLWKEWDEEFAAIREIDAKTEPDREEKDSIIDLVEGTYLTRYPDERDADYIARLLRILQNKHKSSDDNPQTIVEEMRERLTALGYSGRIDYNQTLKTITLKL